MKKSLSISIILLICLFSFRLNAQNTAMPTDSAMWVYGVRLYEDTPQYARNLTVKLKGDTLLGSVHYGKVYYAWGHDTAYDSPKNYMHCFLRNDNNLRTYVRYPTNIYNNDTSDFLIYDFNQAEGDTFNLPVHQVGIDTPWCDTTYKYLVSVAFMGWDGFLNRNIHNIQYQSANSTCTYLFSQMGEFYGSDNFIFYNELKIFPMCDFWDVDSIFSSQLRCFWYKGKWKNQPCELWVLDISENSFTETEIIIIPNPFQEKAVLSFSAGKYSAFQLIDILGKLVYETRIDENQNNIILQKDKLKRGFYFGRFIGKRYMSRTIKIVIN